VSVSSAVSGWTCRCRAVTLPGMRAARWGRIVNVTTLTTLGTPERTLYAAAKAALEICTRIWAKELASTGITVKAGSSG
jgi:3-oxoacyl-[acyl-carrier protein] reductase